MSDDKIKYLEMPSVFGLPLSKPELNALDDMLKSPGWAVLMKQKRWDIKQSAKVALSLSADSIDQAMHRAVYHALLGDLTLKTRLDEALRTANVVERDSMSKDMMDEEYDFTVDP